MKKKMLSMILMLVIVGTTLFAGEINPFSNTVFAQENETKESKPSEYGAIFNDTKAISIHENTNSIKSYQAKASELPSVYDLREEKYITPAKAQGQHGTCWAFAAMAAAESNCLKKGILADEQPDFSERHLAYFFYHRPDDLLGNLSGDKTNPGENTTNAYLENGGNNMYTTFGLASWVGAADKKTAPYDQLTGNEEKDALEDDIAYHDLVHLQNSYWIDMNDTVDVKEMLLKYGALAMSYYSDSAHQSLYYNSATSSYYKDSYLSGQEGFNHIVTLVGWDDNYSKENFNESHRPKENGAWLIKNSWGTNFGEDGYFWLSYEDISLCQSWSMAFVYDFESADNYDHNYQYDGSCGGNYNYVANNGSIANVYEVKANPKGSESLEAVSFALQDVNVNYSIQIYTNLTDSNDPTSGVAALETPVTGKTSYVGYYTIPLNQSVLLSENTTYSIVIKLSKSGAQEIAYMVDSSSDMEWINFESSVAKGQSFEKDYEGGTWEDLAESGQVRKSFWEKSYWYDIYDEQTCCARIKGFTKNTGSIFVSDIRLEKEDITIKKGESDKITLSAIEPENADNPEIIFESEDPEIVEVDAEGNVMAKSPGDTRIIVKAKDEGGCVVYCHVKVLPTEEATTEDKQNTTTEDRQDATTQATTEDRQDATTQATTEDRQDATTQATTEDRQDATTQATTEDRQDATTQATTEDRQDATTEDKQNTTTEDRQDATTEDKQNTTTEDRQDATTEDKQNTTTEDRQDATTEDKQNTTTEDRQDATTEDKQNTTTEDRQDATTEDKQNTTTEDRQDATTEDKQNTTTEDRQDATTEDKQNTTTEDRQDATTQDNTEHNQNQIIKEEDVIPQQTFIPNGGSSIISQQESNQQTASATPVLKVAKPARTKITKVKYVSAKKLSLTFKKVKGADGYQIRYGTNKKMKKTKKVTKTKTTLKIKTKKTYYIKVRAYKKNADGKKVYGKYSKIKKVSR